MDILCFMNNEFGFSDLRFHRYNKNETYITAFINDH